jgi:hypothetical protein
MIEAALPLIALGSLYMVSNQTEKENFRGDLPNTNTPDVNFPEDRILVSAEMEKTSKLSTLNKYGGGAYTDKYWSPNGLAQEEDVSHVASSSSYTSLTGDKVDMNYFQHNNMVPFFGSKIRNQHTEYNANESLMDAKTGAGSQSFKKQEISPLFSPATNMQWAYGTPNMTDFMQSRANVSQRMANVKPFMEKQEAPGLGGTGGESAGYNSGMMARELWMPRNVDELRVANKPKTGGTVAYGYEGPAASRVKNIGTEGILEKNRPERAFEWGPERYMTTTGLEKAPTMHADQIDRSDFINRTTTTTSYVGAAGGYNETYTEGEYMPSKHIDLGPLPIGIANCVGEGSARSGEYGLDGQRVYPNNRTTSQPKDDYFGAVGGAFGAAVAPLLDMLRPSRRENVIGTMRPYQNPKSEVNAPYMYNPADRPATTIRETTEESNGHLFINRGQGKDGYLVTKPVAAYTTRSETGDHYYAGTCAGPREMRRYDAEYNQRNNEIKSATIDGRLVPGNMSLMNGNINMRNKTLDNDLKTRRGASGPKMPSRTPEVGQMGYVSNSSNMHLYNGISLDRNQPDMLEALKSNPYTQNIMGAFSSGR